VALKSLCSCKPEIVRGKVWG